MRPTAPFDGLILIDKPTDLTSLDVIRVLRRMTKQKSFGHTGTLDPLATGMLPILCGQYTRYAQYIISQNKCYTAEIQLGTQTDTDDKDGNITDKSEHHVTQKDIEIALKDFIGNITQTPPVASAIRVQGKRLYEYHRRGIKPPYIPSRSVHVSAIKLLNFDDDNQVIRCKITCSSGTYIRSIARDLGASLNTFGHITALRRDWVEPFQNHPMIQLDHIQSLGEFSQYCTPLKDAFRDNTVTIDKEQALLLAQGKSTPMDHPDAETIALLYHDIFFGLAKINNKVIKTRRLLKNPIDFIINQ